MLFTGAVFSGGQVSFSDARFSGGTVRFSSAEFSGGKVDFEHAMRWAHPPTFPWDGKPPIGVLLPAQAPKEQS